MDPIRALTGKIDRLVRPGAALDTSGAAYPGRSVASAADLGGGNYITWSGTSATIHDLIVFGWAGHGFGEEFA